MRAFLDTNVIIDFCTRREDFFKPAAVIFQLSEEKKIELAASATTFINSFYILRKVYGHEELYARLKNIAASCIISSTDKAIINKAFENNYPDFEDAVQYFSAKTIDADVIITRNVDDFVMAKDEEVMTPEMFLDKFFTQQN